MNQSARVKQIEVQIMSQSYVLACPTDGEAALREAVARVDGAMCRIRDAGKVKARDRIAVLAALNLAFEQQLQEPGGFRNTSFGQSDSGDGYDSGERALDSRIDALIERIDRVLQAQPLPEAASSKTTA